MKPKTKEKKRIQIQLSTLPFVDCYLLIYYQLRRRATKRETSIKLQYNLNFNERKRKKIFSNKTKFLLVAAAAASAAAAAA